MANSVQCMRVVFDAVKTARDNDNSLTDEQIQNMLSILVTDEKIRNRYNNFSKGYYAEELFRRIYSLLPWVELITPLGQEQYPENSKETIQVPDYEVMFQNGDLKTHKVLIEAKLVDGDKQTFELLKHTYNGLRKYEENSPYKLVFAIFWRKKFIWTVNSIESFSEKSSSYKISFEEACQNDVSAIFGDYSYVFKEKLYRKSRFSNIKDIESKYYHFHEKYGRTIYDGVSIDVEKYNELHFIETALLDCAFDFEQIHLQKINDFEIEIIEKKKNDVDVYKLSSLLISYLLKIYCYDNNDMYCKDNFIVQKAFDIVDTIRRKCGGEKFYLIPYDGNLTIDNLMNVQFKNTHIIENYYNVERNNDCVRILCSHN